MRPRLKEPGAKGPAGRYNRNRDVRRIKSAARSDDSFSPAHDSGRDDDLSALVCDRGAVWAAAKRACSNELDRLLDRRPVVWSLRRMAELAAVVASARGSWFHCLRRLGGGATALACRGKSAGHAFFARRNLRH